MAIFKPILSYARGIPAQQNHDVIQVGVICHRAAASFAAIKQVM